MTYDSTDRGDRRIRDVARRTNVVRRLGAAALAVVCIGAMSVSAAPPASAGLLDGLLGQKPVRVIVTARDPGSAQALVVSLLGAVVTDLPLINGVVPDVSPSPCRC